MGRIMANESAESAVRAALLGVHDERSRLQFLEHFHGQVAAFEHTMIDAYSRWIEFGNTFAKDHDSATVVGTLFTVVARTLLSMKLLMLGHLTMAGAAQRQACEALAAAFLFAERDWTYRRDSWDGRFSVNKAVGLVVKRSGQLNLNSEALRTLLQAQDFYNKFSHPTALAMADLINLKGGGHHLGASFDPHKLPFYEKELASRLGFAGILVNAIDGVEQQMRRWPEFRR